MAGTGVRVSIELGGFRELVDLIGRKQETDRVGRGGRGGKRGRLGLGYHEWIVAREREKHLSGK
jgi:hypothetical protein